MPLFGKKKRGLSDEEILQELVDNMMPMTESRSSAIDSDFVKKEDMTREDWLNVSEPPGDMRLNELLQNMLRVDSLAQDKYKISSGKSEDATFLELLKKKLQSILPERPTIDMSEVLTNNSIKNLFSGSGEEPWFNPEGSSYETGPLQYGFPYIPPQPMGDDAINREIQINSLKEALINR
jgi:hypothetical protein